MREDRVLLVPVILAVASMALATLTTIQARADPAHCDQTGWPSCYNVGYSDGQQNPGTGCPSGHSSEFCRGWDNAAGSGSSSSSSSTSTSAGNNCTSEGCTGDFTCVNPNQPADSTGCPNDPTHQHHTADYNFGYKIGQQDGRAGVFDIGSSCDSAPQHNFSHCSAGYTDGYKSICGSIAYRPNTACN
jgi:hypothetical protein